MAKTDQKDEVLDRMVSRRRFLGDALKRALVGRRETIKHPVELVKMLDGFGDFLADSNVTPSLASLAIFLGVSKELLYDLSQDSKKYYYYEIQDALGDVIDIRAINYEEELEYVSKGNGVSILPFFDLQYLIDLYALKHDTQITNDLRSKITSYKGCYIKRFHKVIASKKRHKLLRDKIHAMQKIKRAKNVGHRFRLYWKAKLNEQMIKKQSFDRSPKEIYALSITGNVIVRGMSFQEVIQVYKNIAEVEWIEIGANARNPAMSIFMLLNNSGYRPLYENKQVTQITPSQSQLEIQQAEARLTNLLEEFIKK